ncbi:hypothetical protein K431DRAFT_2253 [Polychaeton citri CBS 116435]|uniref:C2H2-type domain-containing protein n=1 Tax=Polychaeton citri CBS 116435 TaxID=1314669 RepID=A0A9P4QJL6_9PEZI|nr:hypothetical protein K431DRAFT_2253 [Polychaeton citri CBS 116435]
MKFVCRLCGEFHELQSSLETHLMDKHILSWSFECSFCNARLGDEAAIRIHCSEKHPLQLPGWKVSSTSLQFPMDVTARLDAHSQYSEYYTRMGILNIHDWKLDSGAKKSTRKPTKAGVTKNVRSTRGLKSGQQISKDNGDQPFSAPFGHGYSQQTHDSNEQAGYCGDDSVGGLQFGNDPNCTQPPGFYLPGPSPY